jgi:uncharacterized protein
MKSPCIDVCRFDGATGWCVGCGRTLPECREWKRASNARLKAISAELPHRLKRLARRGVLETSA